MQLGVFFSRAAYAAACILAVKLSGFGIEDADATVRSLPSGATQTDFRNVAKQLDALEVPFQVNVGELDSRVALYARTITGTLYVGRDGVLTYLLRGAVTGGASKDWALKEQFIGAKALHPAGRESTPTRVSRFSGHAAAPNAATSTFRWADLGEVWHGVSVSVRSRNSQAEKFFHIAPGAHAADIRISMQGAQRIVIDRRGDLVASTGIGEAVFSKPVAWQEIGAQRRAVTVHYALLGTHDYGFVLDAYDHGREVIIDPLLQSTYIGGSGSVDGVADRVSAIAINQTSGDVYVTGSAGSPVGFPITAGALQANLSGETDAFIARLPADLKSFTQVTYLGGSQGDEGQAILIHPLSGDIYVAGYTRSDDFPGMASGAIAVNAAGNGVAFIARLDATLSTLRQATYYGSGIEAQDSTVELLKLAVDPSSGEMYLAGPAFSSSLQGTAGGAIATTTGQESGFIAKFAADLKTLIQATYISGTIGLSGFAAQTIVGGLVIDPVSADVLIAGESSAGTLPVTAGAFQATRDPNMGETGFVARLPKSLTSFIAFSYMQSHTSSPASDHQTTVTSLALNPLNGDIYLYGATDGDKLDGTSGAYLPSNPINSPAEFITRIAPDLSVIRASTFLSGGGVTTNPYAIRIPASGDIYTLGETCGDTTGGIQTAAAGVCIQRFTPDLHSLVQASELGGPGQNNIVELGNASTQTMMVLGDNGDIYVVGGTTSTSYPGTSGGAQATAPAGSSINGYVARITQDLQGTPQPGTIQFSASTYSVADTVGSVNIVVNRINGSSGAVSVSFATSDGTGKAGIDYTATTQTVNFADGDAAQKFVTVPVKTDGAVLGNKTVNLTLSAVTGGAALGSQTTAVLTITQTAVPVAGALQFSTAAYAVADNAGNAVISVTRSGGSAGAVSVTFTTADGTGKSGTNYAASTQAVAFAGGDTAAKTINVPVKVSGTVGDSFTVNLTLTAPTAGATLGSPATAVLTISATTAAPVIPPPVSTTVTVTGKGGGGAIGAWEIVVLGGLLLLQLLRARRFALKSIGVGAVLGVAAFLSALGYIPQAKAESPEYYAGFGFGQARSVATASDLERKLEAAGFSGATVALDDHKLAGKIFAGVSFNQYFSLEAAYVDLNRVRTHSTASTTDAAAFVAAVTAIHPYSARGGALTAMATLPLVGGLSAFARGGGFVWHGEIDADIPGIDSAETKKTSVSGVVGAGLDFVFARRVALRAEWERYFITRDSMDLLTVGLRVRF